MFCPYCNAVREGILKKIQEVYPVKGEDCTIIADVCVCEICGNEIWNEEHDAQNLLRAFDIYRKRHGLLSPDEIRKIRNSYGLSQTSFARVLGLGDKTITRYENGSIPDAAQNNLIELMDNAANFRQLLEKNRDKISDQDYEAATQRLEQFSPKLLPYPVEYSNKPKMRYSVNKEFFGGLKHA